MARSTFPRRRNRLVLTRTSAAFAQVFRDTLVDAALVDVGAAATAGEETWRVAALAREFPQAEFRWHLIAIPIRQQDERIEEVMQHRRNNA